VLSYSIAQRSREIGLRTALGAQQRQIVQLVLRQGVITAAVGLFFGLAISLASAKALAPLLFGVATYDTTSFAVVAIGLAAVVVLSCIVPARRAARLDPLVTLRRQ
jgi:ABC-type antimicrobial peptide transport system permease subunit